MELEEPWGLNDDEPRYQPTIEDITDDEGDYLTMEKKKGRANNMDHRPGSAGSGVDRKKDPYKCDRCEFGTSDFMSFITHKNAHAAQESKTSLFTCGMCDFVTLNPQQMTEHIQSHLQPVSEKVSPTLVPETLGVTEQDRVSTEETNNTQFTSKDTLSEQAVSDVISLQPTSSSDEIVGNIDGESCSPITHPDTDVVPEHNSLIKPLAAVSSNNTLVEEEPMSLSTINVVDHLPNSRSKLQESSSEKENSVEEPLEELVILADNEPKEQDCSDQALRWVSLKSAEYSGPTGPLPGYPKDSVAGNIAADSLIGYLELRRIKPVVPALVSHADKEKRTLPSNKPNSTISRKDVAIESVVSVTPVTELLSYKHDMYVRFYNNKRKVIATNKDVKTLAECKGKLSTGLNTAKTKASSESLRDNKGRFSGSKAPKDACKVVKTKQIEADHSSVAVSKHSTNKEANLIKKTKSQCSTPIPSSPLKATQEGQTSATSKKNDRIHEEKSASKARKRAVTSIKDRNATVKLLATSENQSSSSSTKPNKTLTEETARTNKEQNGSSTNISIGERDNRFNNSTDPTFKPAVNTRMTTTNETKNKSGYIENSGKQKDIVKEMSSISSRRMRSRSPIEPVTSKVIGILRERFSEKSDSILQENAKRVTRSTSSSQERGGNIEKAKSRDVSNTRLQRKSSSEQVSALTATEKQVTKTSSNDSKKVSDASNSSLASGALDNSQLNTEAFSHKSSQTTLGNNEKLVSAPSSNLQGPEVNMQPHKKPKRDILLRYQSEVSQENLTEATPEQMNEIQCNKVIDFVTETYDLGMTFQTGCFVGISPTADAQPIAVKELKSGQPCKIVLSRCSVIDHMNSVTPSIALQLKSSLQDCWNKIISKSSTSDSNTNTKSVQTQQDAVQSRKRKLPLPKNDCSEKSEGHKKTQKTYKCQLCEFTTGIAEELFSHSAETHTEEESMYVCEQCDYITSRQSKLLAHVKCHSRPASTFTPKATKRQSADASSSGENIVESDKVCETPPPCDASSATISEQYKILVQLELGDGKLEATNMLSNEIGKTSPDAHVQYACKSCSYHSPRLHALQMHERAHRADKKNYPCRHCDYSTSRWLRYVEHQYTHKNIFELHCYYDNCEFTTTDSQVLKSHRLLHKVVPQHICDKCGYTTFRRDLLNKHCIKNHSTDPAIEGKLHRFHTSTIQKELPFKCVICWYTARDSKTLSKHMQIHGKPKETGRFRCNMCKFSTNFEFGLKRHIAHSKVCQRQSRNSNSF